MVWALWFAGRVRLGWGAAPWAKKIFPIIFVNYHLETLSLIPLVNFVPPRANYSLGLPRSVASV